MAFLTPRHPCLWGGYFLVGFLGALWVFSVGLWDLQLCSITWHLLVRWPFRFFKELSQDGSLALLSHCAHDSVFNPFCDSFASSSTDKLHIYDKAMVFGGLWRGLRYYFQTLPLFNCLLSIFQVLHRQVLPLQLQMLQVKLRARLLSKISPNSCGWALGKKRVVGKSHCIHWNINNLSFAYELFWGI